MNYTLNLVEYPREAPTIVFFHGLGGTHRYWLTGLERLKAHYSIVLVDLLGFGDSDKPWVNYTRERHLRALEHALHGFDAFFLIGHSVGASLALAYSARNPKQVLGQILISMPFFPTEQRAYQWFRRTPSGWILTNMLTTIAACIVTRRIMGVFLPKILSNFPLEVAQDLLKHNFMSSTTTLWQVVYHSTLATDADRLSSRIKTICIHSVDDDTAPYSEVANLLESHQRWELQTLQNSFHHPWLWDNERCVDFVLEALQCWTAKKQSPILQEKP